MQRIIRSLRHDLSRAFTALAYSHSGEMLTRSNKRQVLFGEE